MSVLYDVQIPLDSQEYKSLEIYVVSIKIYIWLNITTE